jgi:hypothetical protein
MAATLIGQGCATGSRTPAWLSAWSLAAEQDTRKLDQPIKEDYESYVKSLPHGQRERLGIVTIYEDGLGHRGIRIELDLNGTWREHFLVYDASGARIKTVKWNGGRYRC